MKHKTRGAAHHVLCPFRASGPVFLGPGAPVTCRGPGAPHHPASVTCTPTLCPNPVCRTPGLPLFCFAVFFALVTFALNSTFVLSCATGFVRCPTHSLSSYSPLFNRVLRPACAAPICPYPSFLCSPPIHSEFASVVTTDAQPPGNKVPSLRRVRRTVRGTERCGEQGSRVGREMQGRDKGLQGTCRGHLTHCSR